MWKESLNSDDQQFHQYQQNEQYLSLNIKNIKCATAHYDLVYCILGEMIEKGYKRVQDICQIKTFSGIIKQFFGKDNLCWNEYIRYSYFHETKFKCLSSESLAHTIIYLKINSKLHQKVYDQPIILLFL